LTSKNWLIKAPSFDDDDNGNVAFIVVLLPNHHERKLETEGQKKNQKEEEKERNKEGSTNCYLWKLQKQAWWPIRVTQNKQIQEL
jgi:hypothetical protein